MTARRARQLVAFAAGLVFAVGLGLAGMTKPSKVLAFLDLTGDWDPSLMCVMGAALGLNIVLFRWILRRAAPRFDQRFHLPELRVIDGRLLGGAALFGIGWGLAGYCPGPAVVAAGTGAVSALVFTAAMIVGMEMFRWLASPARRQLEVRASVRAEVAGRQPGTVIEGEGV